MIFENYSRSEAALIAGMAEMVVNGVSILCDGSWTSSRIKQRARSWRSILNSLTHLNEINDGLLIPHELPIPDMRFHFVK